MGSLTGCLKKAGDLLQAEDRRAILELADAYRKDGMSAAEAARAAVQGQVSFLRWSKETAQGALDSGTEVPGAREFVSSLRATERPSAMGPAGLSDAGFQRMRSDAFARAFGSDALLRSLDDAGLGNVADGLVAAAPALARGDVGGILDAARSLARGGDIPPELSAAAEALRMRSGSPESVAGLVKAGGDPLMQARMAEIAERHPNLLVRMDGDAEAMTPAALLKRVEDDARAAADDAELLRVAAECALDAGM